MVLVFIGTWQVVLGQDKYYFVSFKDKINNGYTMDQPEAFLSQKAIDRRQKQGIVILEQDEPVTEAYKISIIGNGIEVFESSKWLNGVIIRATQPEADLLKNEQFVETVTYLAPQNYAGRKNKNKKLSQADDSPSDSLFQNQILNIKEMHDDGFSGQGMIVALMDGGFDNVDSLVPFQHLFTNGQLLYTYDFVSKTDNVYQHSAHGTQVLSLMAAIKDDSYQGIITDANFMLFVTENVPTEYSIEEYYWLIAAERADSAGVDVISTSLGYSTFDDPAMNYTFDDLDGITSVITRAAHIASEKGIAVVVATGNEAHLSWGTITCPSDLVNGLAVGSIQTNYERSIFSSTGPSSDGRIKPDVVALGSQAYVINQTGNVVTNNGTSFSGPQVAALATGIWQAYPSLSYLELIDAIRMSADNVTQPNNELGYGIPSYQAIKNYIEANESNTPVLVYPNPVLDNDVLKVRIVDPGKVNSILIELFDTTGKKLSSNALSVSWSNNEASLQMQHLPQGLYVMKVLFETESEEFRIIKL